MHFSIPKLHLASCAAAVIPLCAASVLIAICERDLQNGWMYQISFEINEGTKAIKKSAYKEAETHMRRALDKCGNKVQYKYPKVVAEEYLADLLMQTERNKEAEPLYQDVIQYKLKTYGAHAYQTARTKNRLGIVQSKIGKLAEANICLNEALTLQEELYGKGSDQYATTLHNLAQLKSDTGQDEEAERLFKLAIAIKSNKVPQSNSIACSYLGLSNLYRKQNRLLLSESAGLQALKIFQLPQYRDGIEAAMCMNNLAVTKCSLGKMNEAQKLYSQALQIANRSLGEDSCTSELFRTNLQSIATKNTTGK